MKIFKSGNFFLIFYFFIEPPFLAVFHSFLPTCRQLGASIFCPQYRELFCPDMGAGVSALAFLDTVPSPEFLIPGLSTD
jgi:hypothetical protein